MLAMLFIEIIAVGIWYCGFYLTRYVFLEAGLTLTIALALAIPWPLTWLTCVVMTLLHPAGNH